MINWKFWKRKKQQDKLSIKGFIITNLQIIGGKPIVYFDNKDMFNTFCNTRLWGEITVFYTEDGRAIIDLPDISYIYIPPQEKNEKDIEYIR